MSENTDNQHERRVHFRRHDDSFENCPRYDRHELSEEQMCDIAKRAVIMAKEESDAELGRLTKKGLQYLGGTLILGLYVWAVQQGLIEVKK